MRMAMKLFGRTCGPASRNEHGFDSGSSLDYVDQNQPQGRTYFGRLVDKIYPTVLAARHPPAQNPFTNAD
ncbi:class I SAM-dependent methyltransferase family protein [Shigella flexneri]